MFKKNHQPFNKNNDNLKQNHLKFNKKTAVKPKSIASQGKSSTVQ
jgi:hypothetical protein